MVIIRMQGGLGNQLFQYALYEGISAKGTAVQVDLSDYCFGKEKRSYELPKLGLEPQTAKPAQLRRYYADNRRLYDRICRHTIGRDRYRKERDYDYEPWALETTDGYLSGYWQSERYFRHAADIIRNKVSFKNTATETVVRYRSQMEAADSVSVHIRLGDYAETEALYGGICTTAYYRNAVQYIGSRIDNPRFYVFSDSPDQAADVMEGCDYELVEGNRGEDSYLDMYLMSLCRHHIIANSTFGWWGAWLDPRPDKIVVTPEKWNHLCKGHEICCDGWIMLGS